VCVVGLFHLHANQKHITNEPSFEGTTFNLVGSILRGSGSELIPALRLFLCDLNVM
jgi:hypothetical protein